MKKRSRLGLLLAPFLLVILGSCGGDDPLDVQDIIDDLVGTWNITSLTYTPVAGGAGVEALVAGTTGVVVFRQDLTYTITFTETGPPMVTDVEDGTYAVAGDVITIVPDNAPGDPSDLEIVSLAGTSLTLLQSDDEYDFNDDGTDTPATTRVVLQKQ